MTVGSLWGERPLLKSEETLLFPLSHRRQKFSEQDCTSPVRTMRKAFPLWLSHPVWAGVLNPLLIFQTSAVTLKASHFSPFLAPPLLFQSPAKPSHLNTSLEPPLYFIPSHLLLHLSSAFQALGRKLTFTNFNYLPETRVVLSRFCI